MTPPEPLPPPPRASRWFAWSLSLAVVVVAVQTFPYRIASRGDEAWLAVTATTWFAVLGHVALFAPSGYCEARFGGAMIGGGRIGSGILLLAVIDVIILAIIAESAQLWIVGRTSNTIDIIAAAIGGTIGAMIAQRRTSP